MSFKINDYTKSREMFERAEKVIPSGVYGHLGPAEGCFIPVSAFPLFGDRAQGSYFWDVDGNKFIDYMCAYGPNVLGYNDPDVDAAALEQAKKCNCTTSPSYKAVEFAELLVDTVNCADWAFFAKNGNDGKLIIAEGYMDVIALHQAGFTNAVACLGTALTKEQANLLSRYADTIILSYDADEAGQKATARALGIFGTTGMEIKVLHLEGGKDPDEIIKNYGVQRFQAIIDGAANDTEYRLLKARQGIDLATDDGKVKYLSAAAEILAEIGSPVEVDVYASRLAHELGVDKLAIQSQVKYKREGLKKRRAVKREQEQTRLLINGQNTKNPERAQHLRAAKAEETLIASLMRNPDFYNKLKDGLSADYFVTALNRRIFSVVLSRLEEGGNTEPYFLSSEFTPDEMDEVERIFRSAAQLSNTVDECADCIKILKEEKNKPETVKASELSDEDFAKLFRSDKRE